MKLHQNVHRKIPYPFNILKIHLLLTFETILQHYYFFFVVIENGEGDITCLVLFVVFLLFVSFLF